MKIKMWIASLLLAFVPAVAGAVTLNPGPTAVGVDAGTAQTFTFTNDMNANPLTVEGLTLSFNNTRPTGGISSLVALANSTWTLTTPSSVGSPTAFFPIVGTAAAAASVVFLPSFTVGVGESFTISFSLAQPGTSGSFSFAASPVPLPAAGWMLLSALGGVAVIARRRKAA